MVDGGGILAKPVQWLRDGPKLESDGEARRQWTLEWEIQIRVV
jgi:hypothetical protein